MKVYGTVALLLLVMACGGEDNLFSGSIEIDEVRISARVGSQITAVPVREGDHVEEGQLLVKLDETQYSLALSQSEAALSTAESRLETLLEGTRQQQIMAASAAVEAGRAEKIQRETNLIRAQELFAAGGMSEQDLQASETAAVTARSRYNSAFQEYSLAVEGARSTEIQAAEAGVQSAEAAVDMSLKQLEWTSVTSPVRGTVTGVGVLAGENTSPGMTLLTVSSLDTVKVIFYISEPLLSRVNTGDPVTVSATESDAVPGSVTHISDQAEFTPSSVETRDGRTSLVYRIEGTVPNPGDVFKGGMPVDVVLPELQ